VDRDTLAAGDFTIRARRTVLATGSIAVTPEIPGIGGVETIAIADSFDLAQKPAHLLVLGSGGRAFELAQAYNRLGIDSTIVAETAALPEDDPELAAIVADRLRAEGVRVRTGVKIVSVGRHRGGIRITVSDPNGGEATIDGSHLLVAAGRAPNVAGLDLAVAGILHDRAGITVDKNLRTSNRRVYAIGDAVAGRASVARAEHHAHRVAESIKFRWPAPADPHAPPVVTFTDPGLASVGLSEAEARARNMAIRVLRFPLVENARAAVERGPEGIAKVIVTPAGRVLGAAVVGHEAGEMSALWSLVIAEKVPVARLASLVTPWPTRADIARRIGLAFTEAADASPRRASWRRALMTVLRKFG
jgi:pyruvate/2-oxoglutarate dehydrogenase complex dihydrolipoamide dehydrogenase (E3) component